MVEGARLESVCRGNSTEGSNPSLSANFKFRSFHRQVKADTAEKLEKAAAFDETVRFGVYGR